MNDKFQYQNLIEMDVSTLTSGLYILKIQTGNDISVKKVVIK